MIATCGYNLYWHNCYSKTYDLIAPDSYAHPAKMAPALCFRILKHLKELGLLKQGDTVLDPLAGTGRTAMCAGAKGYRAITVELEDKFIGFEHQNKDYAERKLHHELDWTILQGDARSLSDLLTERGLVTVSSPPYEDALPNGLDRKAAEQMVQAMYNKHGRTYSKEDFEYQVELILKRSNREYGDAEGQIGNLKDKPLKSIVSPPYGESLNEKKNTTSNLKREERLKTAGHEPKEFMGGTARNASLEDGLRYSHNPLNIGNYPDKPLKTVVSPPYEDALKRDRSIEPSGLRDTYSRGDKNISAGYQTDESNIGSQGGETYLSEMLRVYQEIGKVSDVLAIVIKNPTRGGKLRRLDTDTLRLLELSGWKLCCRHRALLFEELEQGDLFKGSQKKVRGRMSFFKRLSWQNGQPVANWEDVIIAVKEC